MSEDKNKHPEEQILQEGDPETTGHSWDGIKEFNNPLPRWWLWTFYATIVWGIGYTVLYPAWPLVEGATPGILGFSTRANVAEDIQRIRRYERRCAHAYRRGGTGRDQPHRQPGSLQLRDPGRGGDLRHVVLAVPRVRCGRRSGLGYPNLLDDDWLWGGTIEDIHMTISHGIRNEDDMNARYSEMTAFEGILTDDEIGAVVQYVRNISGQEHDGAMVELGGQVFYDNCASCHMDEGTGDQFLGAPNLTDAIWLYGGSEEAIEYTVRNARFGVMPPWSADASDAGRLSEAEVRSVAVYVHSLGGGQ
jgi:cytochrome c oxidase cbb3-type subunit 3